MKMFNKEVFSKYFLIIPTSVWFVIFLIISNKSMILMGDTLEYFNMAKQLNDGIFPKSDKWMPLYPIMIWLVSKIFVVNLLVGSKIYHLILTTTFVFIYNKLFVNKYSKSILEKSILNAPIFCFPIFMQYSVTWMAEFQFLFLTSVVLYQTNEIIKSSSYKSILWATVFVVLSIFTKYNGFVNLFLLFLVIFYNFPLKRSVFISLKLLSALIITYGSWLLYKPGGDFLVGGANNSLTNGLLQETFFVSCNDFVITISKYFMPYRIQEFIKFNLNESITVFLFVGTVLWFLYILIRKYLINKININEIIIAYTILYLVLFYLRGIPTGRSEVNERTLLFVLFYFSILMSLYTIKHRLNFLVVIICMLFASGTLRAAKYLPLMYNQGDGRLSEDKFAYNNPLIEKFLNIKDSFDIPDAMIFSNQERVLGIYNEFNKISSLPTSKVFLGNKYGEDSLKFNHERILFLSKISNNKKWMIIYYHMDKNQHRFDQKTMDLVLDLAEIKDLGILKRNEGMVLWHN
jgi:hypothetical protein